MKKKTNKNNKRNKKRLNKINIISAIIIFFIIIGISAAGGFFLYIYFNAPEFNTDLLYKKESSNIYDSKGNSNNRN